MSQEIQNKKNENLDYDKVTENKNLLLPANVFG